MARARHIVAGIMLLAGSAAIAAGAADPYFLSRENPIANADQRQLETLSLKLAARADVKAACTRAGFEWRLVNDNVIAADQMKRFDQQVSDWCFRSIMIAANSDPNVPRVLRVYSPGGTWLGHDMPASKWGGDNPDNAYRIIPVEPGATYQLTGQRQTNPSTYVTFQIVGNTTTSETLGSLEQRDMTIGADGRYTLTLDGKADGGPNHMRIPEGAKYLFVRDSMGDWSQTPDALRIRLLSKPSRMPLNEDEIAARAAHNAIWDVFYGYYAARLFTNQPQKMSKPMGAGAVGGLVTQMGSQGHIALADDEAAIITATASDATYRNIVLHDMWLRSLNFGHSQSSLNNAQMTPDADGRFTYVVSARDPGVANWLDNEGLHDVLILHRWQGFPESGSKAVPAISTRIVKFADLASALPAGVAKIDADGRRKQLAARTKSYDRRFIDK